MKAIPYRLLRVSLRRDTLDTFDNGADGRFEELFDLVPGQVDRIRPPGSERKKFSPLDSELPIFYTTTQVVVPWRAEFHVLGFSVICEGRLQPGVETLS